MAKKRRKSKKPLIDPKFALIIFIISVLSIIGNIAFGFDLTEFTVLGIKVKIQETIFHLNIFILGIGFIIEGSFLTLLKRLRKEGVSADEVVHATTVILGIFLIFSGAWGMLAGEIPPVFKPIVGFASIISLFVAMAQYFIVRQ